eukprot:TRINITY_DN7835_c0_g1_i2.p1 TRINITY_DN7835_c0_g1~~TRINITY_DN7835_c0_g1_i2.p1  ORF type:complete len:329 (-),score=59.42 TRINITY_DN7835_c0_g1_i2:169-1155(-)
MGYKNLGKTICQTLFKLALAEVDYIPNSLLQQEQKKVIDRILEEVYKELELNPNCCQSNICNSDDSSGFDSEAQSDENKQKENLANQNQHQKYSTTTYQQKLFSSPFKYQQYLKKFDKGSGIKRCSVETQTDVDIYVIQCQNKILYQIQQKWLLQKSIGNGGNSRNLNYNQIINQNTACIAKIFNNLRPQSSVAMNEPTFTPYLNNSDLKNEKAIGQVSKKQVEKKVSGTFKGNSNLNEMQLYTTYASLQQQNSDQLSDSYQNKILNLSINQKNGNVKKVQIQKYYNQSTQTYITFKKILQLCGQESQNGGKVHKDSEQDVALSLIHI